MSQEMKPSEILALAEVYLDECGWHQGCLEHSGRICAMGAIHAAIPGNRVSKRYREVLAFLEYTAGVNVVSTIAAWNDAPGRTVKEVKAALRKARDLAAKEGR